MIWRKSALLFFLVLLTAVGVSQNETDALRLGRLDYSGTARFNALGGAMGALGGDPSVVSTNPAGLGVFRRSELSITPSYYFNNSSTTFNGNTNDANYNNLGLNNLAMVFSKEQDNVSGLLQTSWGIAYNRQANFFSETNHQTDNPYSSLLDIFRYDLENPKPVVMPNEIGEFGIFDYDVKPAYDARLLNYDSAFNGYVHANEGYEGKQRKTYQESGSLSEINIGYGGNYNNRIYFGASLAITLYQFTQRTTYSEYDLPDSTQFTTLKQYNFEEELDISGSGFKGKFGLIYRVNDYLRLGLAYHTPSQITIDDQYSTTVESSFQSNDYQARSPISNFGYTIRQPGRLQASAGIILGKAGLIGIEYEYADFRKLELREAESGFSFDPVNNTIQDIYRQTHHLRIGGEARFSQYFVRGGFRYDQDPYVNGIENDSPVFTYSFGAGVRQAGFYVDVTWRWRQYSENLWIYDPAFIEKSEITYNSHAIMISAAYRWK
jgi:long-subunit fatty acid transport protein